MANDLRKSEIEARVIEAIVCERERGREREKEKWEISS